MAVVFVGMCVLVLVSCAETVPPPTQTPLSVQEYAQTCAELMNVEMASGGQGERQFVRWVDDLLAVEPPTELIPFHAAVTTQFSSQVEAGGPNSEAHAAFIQQHEILDAMPLGLRQVLVEEGCIDDADVLIGRNILAARERVATRGPAPNPPTVRDYGERCRDVEITVPIMDSLEAVLAHIVEGLRDLVPPVDLERYHDNIIRFYLSWQEYGLEAVDTSLILAVQKEVDNLDPSTYEVLVSTGCIKKDSQGAWCFEGECRQGPTPAGE